MDCSDGSDEWPGKEEPEPDPVTDSAPVVMELSRGDDRGGGGGVKIQDLVSSIRDIKNSVMSLIKSHEQKDDDDNSGGSSSRDDGGISWLEIMKMILYIVLVLILSVIHYVFGRKFLKRSQTQVNTLFNEHFQMTNTSP